MSERSEPERSDAPVTPEWAARVAEIRQRYEMRCKHRWAWHGRCDYCEDHFTRILDERAEDRAFLLALVATLQAPLDRSRPDDSGLQTAADGDVQSAALREHTALVEHLAQVGHDAQAKYCNWPETSQYDRLPPLLKDLYRVMAGAILAGLRSEPNT